MVAPSAGSFNPIPHPILVPFHFFTLAFFFGNFICLSFLIRSQTDLHLTIEPFLSRYLSSLTDYLWTLLLWHSLRLYFMCTCWLFLLVLFLPDP
ncbi:hypothetical protein BDZ91DRAFT_715574 [Kalaharituber pfeilii]|nr:hypothetical protein BDZ91DRAFT_715574 [Kalaharituber pfeilii]